MAEDYITLAIHPAGVKVMGRLFFRIVFFSLTICVPYCRIVRYVRLCSLVYRLILKDMIVGDLVKLNPTVDFEVFCTLPEYPEGRSGMYLYVP